MQELAERAVAVLEVLVHLDLPPELAPLDYIFLAIEVLDAAPAEQLINLLSETRTVGDDLLTQQKL